MAETKIEDQDRLAPCPHCGGGVSIVKINGKWLIDCPTCERHHWESNVPCKYQGKDGLIEWWNTRNNGTCEWRQWDQHSDEYFSTGCGREFQWATPYDLPNCCPGCGRKVVDAKQPQ